MRARTGPSRHRSTSPRRGSAPARGCSPPRSGLRRRGSGSPGSSSRRGRLPGTRCCTGARRRRRAGPGTPGALRSPRTRRCLTGGEHTEPGGADPAERSRIYQGGTAPARDRLRVAPSACGSYAGERRGRLGTPGRVVSATEIAFLAFGLVLGVAAGVALAVVIRSRPSQPREVRVTVAPDSLARRRPATLASAELHDNSAPAIGSDPAADDRTPVQVAALASESPIEPDATDG